MGSSSWPESSAGGEATQWPDEIAEYLRTLVLDKRSPAFLVTDADARILNAGGALAHYGVAGMHPGEAALRKAFFLEGLLPLDSSISVLSRVETASETFADIHLFRVTRGDCILFLDATEEVAERTQIEEALRRAEEQLRQAEKMEALGRLVGGVAHDFNNLLTVILGYAHMLTSAPIPERYRSAASEIKRATENAAQMTRQLLSFSRSQVRRVEVFDLNSVVSKIHPLLHRLIGEDIVFTTKPSPSKALIEGDAGQMEQVLMNLAANARDAMPQGGTLEIEISRVDIGDVFLAAHGSTQLRPGRHVELSVRDNGCGMDADILARAFEPFFTSKAPGHGTGLGLSIVYGIVRQNGGDIFLTSRAGEGTEVVIVFPEMDQPGLKTHNAADESFVPGTETILLVEDDDAVRRMVKTILTGLGYQVREAAEPHAALMFCEQHSGKLDLLITDLIMPQMDGRELAARVVAAHPETRVLYMSGYARESSMKRGIDLRSVVFLNKPFTPGALANRVRQALSHPAR